MSAHPGYEFHPTAEALPLPESEAFDALVADIRANGLISPIALIDGRMILNCRNCIQVCIAAAARGGRTPSSSATLRDEKRKDIATIPRAVPEPPPTGLR